MSKIIYHIKIRKEKNEFHPEEKFVISVGKNIGDNAGGCFGARNRQEVIDLIKKRIEHWEEYDSILGRISDKVTIKNTELTTETDITFGELIGVGLSSFFRR